MRLSKKKRRSNLAVGIERMLASVSVPASMQLANIDLSLSAPVTSGGADQRPALQGCANQASRSPAIVTIALNMPPEVNHFTDAMRSLSPIAEHVSPSVGQSDDVWKYFNCEFCEQPVRGGQACHCSGAMAKCGLGRP